ncbi:MAG TPA: hypothetical protein VG604_03260 [Candidatus Saccharimonadales bacterium]|nr:hypothetical protein [Candidatus Saccharimonadales bacterium]
MSSRGQISARELIRDPNQPIPDRLLNPHYLDRDFAEKNVAKAVFLAADVELDDTGRVPGAYYMSSVGYALWLTIRDFQDSDKGRELPLYSAAFFEAAINDYWPRLDERSSAVYNLGRCAGGVDLKSVSSGIQGSSLFSFNEFAIVPRPE